MSKLLLAILVHSMHIMQFNPKLTPEQALNMAFLIHKYSQEYRVPATTYLAILGVESGFNLNAYNPKTKDYGIAQINRLNIKSMGLNEKRLLTDLDYSIKHGAVILSTFYKLYGKKLGKNWVSRYNCGMKPRCEKKKKGRQYIKRVYKHMELLDKKHASWYPSNRSNA